MSLTRRVFMASGAAMAATPGLGAKRMHVPSEETPHQRTFMMWPVSRIVHPDRRFLDYLQDTIADIANTISEFEPVTMLAHRDEHSRATRRLSGNVELWDIPTEDLWARDAGPLFARLPDGGLAVSHIQFNGWGRKQIHQHDAQVARRVAERLELPVISAGVIGEAGGVDHDGHGTLIAHASSWDISNRNPRLGRDEISTRLLAAYGAHTIHWSEGLLDHDITDYHIDSLARFTGPRRILMNLPDAPDDRDPFHMAALDTYDTLAAAGLDIDVVPEPTRPRVRSADFVASYVNFYACNGAIIAAQFGDAETDRIAREALARHYPGREIVMLDADSLGEIGGGIHCATQQMPA